MANLFHRQTTRSNSQSGFSSAEWDVVSEGAVSQNERYSAGSLSSDESDAVIIFGGKLIKSDQSAVLSQNLHLLEVDDEQSSSCTNKSRAKDFEDTTLDTPRFGSNASHDGGFVGYDTEPWQQKHQRLLSAVSDLASDPGLKRVNAEIYGGMQQSMPIEQRLLDQIAKLAEELDDSQEQAKLLLLQNDRLMSENDQLKSRLSKLVSSQQGEGGAVGDKERESDIMRVTLAVAAGIVIIGLAKKKILFNGVGFLGAAMLGGCMGFYQLMNSKRQEN